MRLYREKSAAGVSLILGYEHGVRISQSRQIYKISVNKKDQMSEESI